MSERPFFINIFEYERDEFADVMSMIRVQLEAGRDLCVTGGPGIGWRVSIPQNRDRYAGPKATPVPRETDDDEECES